MDVKRRIEDEGGYKVSCVKWREPLWLSLESMAFAILVALIKFSISLLPWGSLDASLPLGEQHTWYGVLTILLYFAPFSVKCNHCLDSKCYISHVHLWRAPGSGCGPVSEAVQCG